MMQTDRETLQAIVAQAVAAALKDVPILNPEEHAEHHEFMRILLEREKRRKDMYDKVIAQVFGWGLVAAVGGIGATVWFWLQSHITR